MNPRTPSARCSSTHCHRHTDVADNATEFNLNRYCKVARLAYSNCAEVFGHDWLGADPATGLSQEHVSGGRMKLTKFGVSCFRVAAVATVWFGSTDTSGAQAIEEIVVTATKRGDVSLQQTPLSISAISGERLTETGTLDFNDYFRQVPGLSTSDQGPGDKRYIIRGINSGGAGTVGLYFDEVIVTGENLNTEGGRQTDIKLFDMERIEVLRGPQGTTFGSSSLSGTIRWIPSRPDLGEYLVDGGVGILATKDSSGIGWQGDGMVNLPIIEDRLAVRLSGMLIDKKGYIDNRFRNDANNDDTKAFRGMVAWEVSDAVRLSFLGMHQDSKTNGRAGRMFQGIDLPASPTLNGGPVPKNFNTDMSDGRFDDKIDLFNVKLDYTRSWGTFTATSSLFQRDTEFDRDASAEIELITGGAFPADGAGQSFIIQPQDRELLTHEVRFASSWDGALQVLVGAFLQEEERKFRSAVITVDAETGRITPSSIALLDRRVLTEVDEVAVFGELSWDIVDRLTLTGGFRWFDFELAEQADAVTGFPGVPGPGQGPQLASSTDDVIFRVNVAYQLTDDVMTYLQFAQGFRAGGTNDQTAASLAGVTIPAGFNSDSLDNYELGFKSSWYDSRLFLNGSLYFIDWSDIQVRQQATAPGGLTFTYRGNGGAAEVKGVELELQAYPTESLQVGFGVNYSDAKLTEDLPIPADGQAGDDIEFVPDITLNLNSRYQWPIGARGWTGFVGGDWAYVDEQTNRLRPTSPQFREIDSYSILNLRIGLEGEDWTAILGVDNVFDEDGTVAYIYNGGNQPAVGFVPPAEIRPWPRMLTFNVRKSFDF